MPPDELPPEYARQAIGLDGIVVPTANFPEVTGALRTESRKLGLKLAVYMHDSDVQALVGLIQAQVDYVTSYVPQVFGEARERCAEPDSQDAGGFAP